MMNPLGGTLQAELILLYFLFKTFSSSIFASTSSCHGSKGRNF